MVIFGPQEGKIDGSLFRRVGFYLSRLWCIRVKEATDARSIQIGS